MSKNNDPITKQFFEEQLQTYNNDVMTKLDDVVGRLQTIQEELDIRGYHIDSLRETSEHLEKRVGQLEKTIKPA